MNWKKYISLILFVLPLLSSAQQDPNFNQYFFNPLTVNPAYAGSRGTLSAIALHRSQWVGFDGAPTTQAFSIHSPTKNKKMGLGLQLMNDNIGPKNTVSISGVYAYKIRFAKGQLGFGLRASLYNYAFNWDEIEYKDETAFSANQRGKETYLLPSFDFGLYYSDNKNYVGLELTHLNQGRIGVQGDNVNIQSTVEQSAQAIFTAGRAFKLSPMVTLKPSVLVKAGGNQPAFVDLNASVLLKESLWLGVSYRHESSIAAIIEYNINKEFRIGYSYDIATTIIGNQNGGSHEIFIGYDLNLFKAQIVSPRYF